MKNVNVRISEEAYTTLRMLAVQRGATNARVIELALAALSAECRTQPPAPPELAVGVTHIVSPPAIDELTEVIDVVTGVVSPSPVVTLEVGRNVGVGVDLAYLPLETTTADDPHDADPDDGDRELPVGSEGASTLKGEDVQGPAGVPGETLVAGPEDGFRPSAPADLTPDNGIAANPFEPATPKGEDDAWLEDLLGQV